MKTWHITKTTTDHMRVRAEDEASAIIAAEEADAWEWDGVGSPPDVRYDAVPVTSRTP